MKLNEWNVSFDNLACLYVLYSIGLWNFQMKITKFELCGLSYVNNTNKFVISSQTKSEERTIAKIILNEKCIKMPLSASLLPSKAIEVEEDRTTTAQNRVEAVLNNSQTKILRET